MDFHRIRTSIRTYRVHTNIHMSIRTDRIYPSLRTDRIRTFVCTDRIYPSIRTDRIRTSIHMPIRTLRIHPSICTDRIRTSIRTDRIYPSIPPINCAISQSKQSRAQHCALSTYRLLIILIPLTYKSFLIHTDNRQTRLIFLRFFIVLSAESVLLFYRW